MIKKSVWFYIIYFFNVWRFYIYDSKKISTEYVANSSASYFYSDEIGPDRGILLDNPLESGLARLNIIEHTKETLDIAYFSIETGESSNIFFGALMEAADRGVQVNLLLDGMFHGLRGEFKSIIYSFTNHPNMHLKFYEPFNPLMPWTLNNRMHDKYIIADNKIAIIGGRNIGDKYFAPEWYTKSVTNDRDIVIINSKPKDLSSVIFQMSHYFDYVWGHKYSKAIHRRMSRIRYKKGIQMAEKLKEKAKLAKDANKELFEKPIDLMDISLPTHKVSFIHNPIQRFSKEPWCWHELINLVKSAKQSVLIQSPYVIPSTKITANFDLETIQDANITMLTNSLGSTPNLLAYSGYLNHKKKIINRGINVLELQTTDSIHAKSLVIDDSLLATGSFNLDPRSAYLSTESMVVIHSPEIVSHFEEGILDYTDKSLLVLEDYTYNPRSKVNEIKVPFIKKIAVKGLSFIVRWFEYLL